MPRGRKRESTAQDPTSPESPPPSKRTRCQLRSDTRPVSLDTFPLHIIFKIIRYVPIAQWASMERLSHTFRDCVHEAWKRVRRIRVFDDLLASKKYVYFHDKYVSERVAKCVMEKLCERATNLREIGGFPKISAAFSIDSNFDPFDALIGFKKLRRIETDDDDFVRIDRLSTFLTTSPARDRLTDLRLVNSIVNEKAVDHTVLRTAFEQSDDSTLKPLRLESLDLSQNEEYLMCWSYPQRSFAFFETMDVSRLTSFSVLKTYVPRHKLAAFIGRATNLTRLSYYSITCLVTLEVPHIEQLREHFDTDLEIQTVRDGNLAVLRSIGKLQRLESLVIASLYGADGDCLCRVISAAMTDLFRTLGQRRTAKDGQRIFKHLGLLGYVSESEFLDPVAEHLPNLESLALVLRLIDNESLKRALRSQTTLKKLTIENDNSDSIFVNDGQFAIEDILGCASTLECLDIDTSDGQFVQGDMKLIGEFKRLEKLRIRKLEDSPTDSLVIDDAVLKSWADAFGANLKSFVLSGRFPVTNEGVRQFLTKTPRLEFVEFEDLEISDKLLRELPTLCPVVEELCLQSCKKTTSRGVQAVVDGCARMKSLSYWGDRDSWFPRKLVLDKYRRIHFKFD